MARRPVKKEARPPAGARAVVAEFGWPLTLAALGLLGLPLLLYAVGAAGDRVAGFWFGLTFLLVCLIVGAFPAISASPSNAVSAAVLLIALAAGTAATVPLALDLFPGDPAASAALSRQGEEKPLGEISRGGSYDLVVHADLAAVAGREIHADYALKILGGGNDRDLAGRFESRRGRGRAGRRTVEVLRAPREWDHHPIELGPGQHRIRLVKKDPLIPGDLEVKVYAELALWPFAIAAALIALAATALAARLPERLLRRHLTGGIAAALATGILGAWWAWMGDPVFPLLGAALFGMLAGWALGHVLGYVAGRLPWRAG